LTASFIEIQGSYQSGDISRFARLLICLSRIRGGWTESKVGGDVLLTRNTVNRRLIK
jgi:hypothetical protein